MPKKKTYYMGNNPNSPNYDPNIPIGKNKWDEEEFWSDDDEENNDDNIPLEEEWDANTEQETD